eukprot:jgi/Botrbrau1/13511/Bobra.0082s0104.1
MARGKKGEPVDRHKALADELRKKNGVEWREAILADQRVEFIRGKDLARWLQAHEEKLAGVTAAGRVEQSECLRSPSQAKRGFVKFPKKLIPLYQDVSFQEDYFYAWQYERETSPWLYFFSALVVVAVIAACLFPLAPYWLRLTVVYAAMTLLTLIFVILIIRSLIALVTWVTSGYTLWLFPYLLAEDKGITEAFWPIFEVEKPEEGKGSQWWLRAIFAIVLGLCIYGSIVYAPDTGQVRDATKHAHDAILEMLNLHDAGMGKLGTGRANETNAGPTAGSHKGPEGSPQGSPSPSPGPEAASQSSGFSAGTHDTEL